MVTGTPQSDILVNVMNSIDNRLEDVIGARPLGTIADAATDLAPANVLEDVIGIQKPGKVIDRAIADVKGTIMSKKPRRLF